MAIDTAEKRRSVAGIQVLTVPAVTPNASKDLEWRQEAGWSYPGIAAQTIVVVTNPVVRVGVAQTYFTRDGVQVGNLVRVGVQHGNTVRDGVLYDGDG